MVVIIVHLNNYIYDAIIYSKKAKLQWLKTSKLSDYARLMYMLMTGWFYFDLIRSDPMDQLQFDSLLLTWIKSARKISLGTEAIKPPLEKNDFSIPRVW